MWKNKRREEKERVIKTVQNVRERQRERAIKEQR